MYEKHLKRALDVVISGAGLLACALPFALISAAIAADDPGKPMFTQKRVGKNKEFFNLHKFRTMKMSTPHDVPTHLLTDPEQYITRVGKFLRKSSLDELPQLWDIFTGKMSIVGPRPALWNQDDLVAERDKYGANDVRPGLTGWAQINGRDELEIPVKASLDGEYVNQLKKGGFSAFAFDVRCILGTVKSVLKADGVVEGGTGTAQKEKKDKLNVLVVCQHYTPEPFRIADICEDLVHRGHRVSVLTGEPNYPEGEIYKGYEDHQRAHENINGVDVHRCPIIPRKTGIVCRFLNYFSFPVSACRAAETITAENGEDFDVVLVNQLSPVMMALPAITYKKKHRKNIVMYCLDLWPESLIAGGIGRNNPVFKVFGCISKYIYTRMDHIFVTSRLFCDYLQNQFGIEEGKTEYLPQYAEELFKPLPPKAENGVTELLFAGNLGEMQSVQTVLEAALLLQNEKVRFHIVGGGSEEENLRAFAAKHDLSNVIFYGRRPLEEMPSFYEQADAMLVTLKADPVISLTLPGKVQSCMAAAKPVIGCADGETASVIERSQCGLCAKAEDAKALAEVILTFAAMQDKQHFGANGRAYYEQHFAKEPFMDRLESKLIAFANN